VIVAAPHRPFQSGHRSKECREDLLEKFEIFDHFVGLQIESVSVPDKMPKSLEFRESFVEAGIEQRWSRSGNLRRHLVQDILVGGGPRWHIVVDISRETEKNVLDPVVDIVDTRRNSRYRPPIAVSHLSRMLLVKLFHLR
jgi:hypothetical protein